MIVYEVNLDVDAEIAEPYLAWLEAHMREITCLPGFSGAELFECADPGLPAGRRAFCVQYRLRDAESLGRYLHEHAPQLRADGEARFGGRFRAQRRVLELRTGM